MPEPADIWRLIAELSATGRSFAVATLLDASGSTPAPTAARAIVEASGALVAGTIGGGALEAEAQRRAVQTIRSGQPEVFDFDLQGPGPGVAAPICGGVLRVLVDPAAAANRAACAQAILAREQRQRGVILVTVRGESPLRVETRWLDEPAIAAFQGFPGVEALRSVLGREEPEYFAETPVPGRARVEVLVEPLTPKPRLLIVGGGHVGQAVAAQANAVGFEVTVLDDRLEFTRPELFPAGARTRCGPVVREVADFPFASDTFVVLVTRGHVHDAEALAACLRRPAAYIGMIGSRRKVALVRKHFIESGRATAAEFDRVYAPIGLDIGSITVPEIAVSIIAQLIAVRRTGRATRMPAA